MHSLQNLQFYKSFLYSPLLFMKKILDVDPLLCIKHGRLCCVPSDAVLEKMLCFDFSFPLPSKIESVAISRTHLMLFLLPPKNVISSLRYYSTMKIAPLRNSKLNVSQVKLIFKKKKVPKLHSIETIKLQQLLLFFFMGKFQLASSY